MREFNIEDQRSATKSKLMSIPGQVCLAQKCHVWIKEEELPSTEALVDEVVDELYVLNRAKLYDYRGRLIDFDNRCITDDLRASTRHQMLRLLNKAKVRPRQRLQRRQVAFYMWVDLAVKCRKARKVKK